MYFVTYCSEDADLFNEINEYLLVDVSRNIIISFSFIALHRETMLVFMVQIANKKHAAEKENSVYYYPCRNVFLFLGTIIAL